MKKLTALLITAMLIVSTVIITLPVHAAVEFLFTTLSDGTLKVTKYVGSSLTITIPSHIHGKKVTQIGSGGINKPLSDRKTDIVKIQLPDTITRINDNAFFGFTKLQNVNIPEGVKYIGESAFDHCGSLDSLSFPASVTFLGAGALHSISLKDLYVYNPNLNIANASIRGTTRIHSFQNSQAQKFTRTFNSDSNMTVHGFLTFVVMENFSLNKTQLSVGKGERVKLSVTLNHPNLKNKPVQWRTSNAKILTVDQKGNVKTVGKGTAWITVKTADGSEKSCKITVKNAPSKITLTKGILTLGVGETYTLGSAVNDGSACSVRTYRSSNSSILKMTRTDWVGEFKALKAGVSYITVRTYNGKESTCKVTVKPAPQSVKLNRGVIAMNVGDTASLSAIIPDGTGCAKRTFRTSNSNIVKMTKTDWTGNFTAVRSGIAYVTVRTYNGKEASCKIEVYGKYYAMNQYLTYRDIQCSSWGESKVCTVPNFKNLGSLGTSLNKEINSLGGNNAMSISYDVYYYNKILSVVVTQNNINNLKDYHVYNINVETKKRISNSELMRVAGVNPKDYLSNIDSFISQSFYKQNGSTEEIVKRCGVNKETVKKGYDNVLKNPNNRSINTPMHINDNGKLYVSLNINIFVAAEYYNLWFEYVK